MLDLPGQLSHGGVDVTAEGGSSCCRRRLLGGDGLEALLQVGLRVGGRRVRAQQVGNILMNLGDLGGECVACFPQALEARMGIVGDPMTPAWEPRGVSKKGSSKSSS